jgi:proteic killer suppression protein
MEIGFKDKKLKALCEQSNLAQRNLGPLMAKKLRSRLADLQAASVVTDLCMGRPHPLEENRAGEFALDLAHPQRLVFIADNDPIPKKEDGSTDWGQVTQVCIVAIEDYHKRGQS